VKSAEDSVEFLLGETRRDGQVLGMLVAAVRLDADGRICRYIAGRSPAIVFGLT